MLMHRGRVEEKDCRETKKAGRGAGPFSLHSAWIQLAIGALVPVRGKQPSALI
jgi:hypothetical protein